MDNVDVESPLTIDRRRLARVLLVAAIVGGFAPPLVRLLFGVEPAWPRLTEDGFVPMMLVVLLILWATRFVGRDYARGWRFFQVASTTALLGIGLTLTLSFTRVASDARSLGYAVSTSTNHIADVSLRASSEYGDAFVSQPVLGGLFVRRIWHGNEPSSYKSPSFEWHPTRDLVALRFDETYAAIFQYEVGHVTAIPLPTAEALPRGERRGSPERLAYEQAVDTEIRALLAAAPIE